MQLLLVTVFVQQLVPLRPLVMVEVILTEAVKLIVNVVAVHAHCDLTFPVKKRISAKGKNFL